MGQEQKKYHLADNGDIFKINEDGSYTLVSNIENITGNTKNETKSLDLKRWISSHYNWLYMISLAMLIISGLLCVGNSRNEGSEVVGMLYLCVGITSIILPWIFKTIPTVWIILLFIALIVSLLQIIVYSPEWLFTTQIPLTFAILLAFGIAYAKNINIHNK